MCWGIRSIRLVCTDLKRIMYQRFAVPCIEVQLIALDMS